MQIIVVWKSCGLLLQEKKGGVEPENSKTHLLPLII